MKKLLLITLIFCGINSYAQNRAKVDTLYYLLDTAKTPVKDRMWEIHEEYPSLKLLTINCPCLAFGRNPVFVYSTTKEKGVQISSEKLDSIHFISLTELILTLKQIWDKNLKDSYYIVFIEKNKNNYVYQPVRLIRPAADLPPVN